MLGHPRSFRASFHLGCAGSAAHVDGVLQVVRRVQIDELTKAIDFLKLALVGLIFRNQKQ
jgi:hypothetical protein